MSIEWRVHRCWWMGACPTDYPVFSADTFEDAYAWLKAKTEQGVKWTRTYEGESRPRKKRAWFIKCKGIKERYYSYEEWQKYGQNSVRYPQPADSDELSEREEQLELENAAVELGVLFLHRQDEPVLQPATKPVIKSVPAKYLRATRGNAGKV